MRTANVSKAELHEDIAFLEAELAKIRSPRNDYQRRLSTIYESILHSRKEYLEVLTESQIIAGANWYRAANY